MQILEKHPGVFLQVFQDRSKPLVKWSLQNFCLKNVCSSVSDNFRNISWVTHL